MAIASGTKLGPYEIQSPLGAGGMGEVYRARDPRLGREVAIKILPSSPAPDPERLRRFEQEARATAALNHPNILAVFDIGSQDDDSVHCLRTARRLNPAGSINRRTAARAQGRRLCVANRSRTCRRS
jgi:serine/threonine protein kinase